MLRLLWMTLFVTGSLQTTTAQTPTTVFTQSFDWTTNRISILPTTNRCVFRIGDEIRISTADKPAERVPITVYDLYGATVYSGLPGTLTFAPGHYFVECEGDRNQFMVLPSDYMGASFLGDIAYNGYAIGMQRQQQIRPAWGRTGAGLWRSVQPQQGVWNWTNLDNIVEHNGSRKLIVIAAGDMAPEWTQPANLASHYAAYVTALAQRYQGRIAAIEIWNEPDIQQFWNRPDWMSLLAELISVGRSAIKSVDPDILVLAPTWSSVGRFTGTAAMADLGLGAQIDGLSWHDYWSYKFPPDHDISQDNNLFPDILGRVQTHREAVPFPGPVYVTEAGLFGQSALGIPTPAINPSYTGGVITNAPDWSIAMMRAVKYAILYRAAGAQVIIPHVLTLEDSNLASGDNSLYGWEYGARGPEPKTSAFLMSCHWINGAELVDLRTPGDQIFLSAWRRPNNSSVVFAWTIEGQSVPLATSPSTPFDVTDVYGKALQLSELGDHPVIFHSATADAAGLLESVMAALPPLNLAPALAFVPNQTVLKDESLRFTVRATDPDHDPVTYSASPLPPGASLDPVSGAFAWTPAVNEIGAYTITFTATDARGLSDSSTTLVSVLGSNTDGLIGWWKLDETAGLLAADSAGSTPGRLYDFEFTPNSGWGEGRIGNGLEFDGVDDYVDLDSTALSLSNNFTVSSWIRPRGDGFGVFFCLRSRYAESGFRFAVRTNNDLLLAGQTTTGWHITHFAAGLIRDDAWNHVVVVYDKSALVVYVNGNRVDPDIGDWGGDFVMNADGATRIGAERGEGAVGFFFNGTIDDTRIYNRTLSEAEVVHLYQWPSVAPKPPANARFLFN